MGHKSVFDVNTIGDFWSWLSLGFVPLFFLESWDLSESRTNVLQSCASDAANIESFGWSSAAGSSPVTGGLPARFSADTCPEGPPQDLPPEYYGENPSGTVYLYYNRIIGGVRMRQEAQEPSCPPEALSSLFPGAPCFPSSYDLEPELRRGLQTKVELVGGRGRETQYFQTKTSSVEVRKRLHELEDAIWVSPQTQKVELSVPLYNPHTDILTVAYVNFFFTRGGHIWKQIEPVSIWLHPYHGYWCYAADTVWFLLVAKITVQEGIDVIHHWRQLGFQHGTYIYMTIWNFVDWLSVFGSVLIGLLFYIQLGKISAVEELLQAKTDPQLPGSGFASDLPGFFDAIEDPVLFNNELKLVLALYPFFVIGRFFKAFAAQPRLSLVTRTLTNASMDILHFGIVFSTVFSVYALSALLLFGQELMMFASFDRAMNSCWRVVLGDFDWEEMNDVGRLEAGLWFWTFTIVVLQVMVNMLVAVIMDVYTEVKASIGQAETLMSQSREIWHRWRGQRKGLLLPLERILRVLDPTDLEENDLEKEEGLTDTLLTVDHFAMLVKGLRPDQALSILVAAQEKADLDAREDCSMSDAMQKIQITERKIDGVHVQVEHVMYLAEMLSEKQTGLSHEVRKIFAREVEMDAAADHGRRQSFSGSTSSTAAPFNSLKLDPEALPPPPAAALEPRGLSKHCESGQKQ